MRMESIVLSTHIRRIWGVDMGIAVERIQGIEAEKNRIWDMDTTPTILNVVVSGNEAKIRAKLTAVANRHLKCFSLCCAYFCSLQLLYAFIL